MVDYSIRILTRIIVFLLLFLQSFENNDLGIDLEIVNFQVCGHQFLCFFVEYSSETDFIIQPDRKHLFFYTKYDPSDEVANLHSLVVANYIYDIIYNSYHFNFVLKNQNISIKYQYSVLKKTLEYCVEKDSETKVSNGYSEIYYKTFSGSIVEESDEYQFYNTICVIQRQTDVDVNIGCFFKEGVESEVPTSIDVDVNGENVVLSSSTTIPILFYEIKQYHFYLDFNLKVDQILKILSPELKINIKSGIPTRSFNLTVPNNILDKLEKIEGYTTSIPYQHTITDFQITENKLSFLLSNTQHWTPKVISECAKSVTIEKVSENHKITMDIDDNFYGCKRSIIIFPKIGGIQDYVIYFWEKKYGKNYEIETYVDNIFAIPSRIFMTEHCENMNIVQDEEDPEVYRVTISMVTFEPRIDCRFYINDDEIALDEVKIGYIDNMEFHRIYKFSLHNFEKTKQYISRWCKNRKYGWKGPTYFEATWRKGKMSDINIPENQTEAQQLYIEKKNLYPRVNQKVKINIETVEACGIQYVCIKGFHYSSEEYSIIDTPEIVVIYLQKRWHGNAYSYWFLLRYNVYFVLKQSYDIFIKIGNGRSSDIFSYNLTRNRYQIYFIKSIESGKTLNSDSLPIKRKSPVLFGHFTSSVEKYGTITCVWKELLIEYPEYICYLKLPKGSTQNKDIFSFRIYGIKNSNFNQQITDHCCSQPNEVIYVVTFELSIEGLSKYHISNSIIVEIKLGDVVFLHELSVPSKYLEASSINRNIEVNNYGNVPFEVTSSLMNDGNFQIVIKKNDGFNVDVLSGCHGFLSEIEKHNNEIEIIVKAEAHECTLTNAIFALNGSYIVNNVTYFSVKIDSFKKASLVFRNERFLVLTSEKFNTVFNPEPQLSLIHNGTYKATFAIFLLDEHISCQFERYNNNSLQFEVERKFLTGFKFHYNFTLNIKMIDQLEYEIIFMKCTSERDMRDTKYYLEAKYNDGYEASRLKLRVDSEEWRNKFSDIKTIVKTQLLVDSIRSKVKHSEYPNKFAPNFTVIGEIEKRLKKITNNITFKNIQVFRFYETSHDFSFAFKIQNKYRSSQQEISETKSQSGSSQYTHNRKTVAKVSIGAAGFSKLTNLTISYVDIEDHKDINFATGVVIIKSEEEVDKSEYIMNYTVAGYYDDHNFSCVWMKENMTNLNKEGCQTQIFRSKKYSTIMCQCNHLKSFAVIFEKLNNLKLKQITRIAPWISIIPISTSMILLSIIIISLMSKKILLQKDTEMLSLAIIFFFTYAIHFISIYVLTESYQITLIIQLIEGYAIITLYLTLGLYGCRVYHIMVKLDFTKHFATGKFGLIIPELISILWLLPAYFVLSKSDLESSFTESNCYITLLFPVFCIVIAFNIFVHVKIRLNQDINWKKIEMEEDPKQIKLILFSLFLSLSISWILRFLLTLHVSMGYLFKIVNGSNGIILFIILYRNSIKSTMIQKTPLSEIWRKANLTSFKASTESDYNEMMKLNSDIYVYDT